MLAPAHALPVRTCAPPATLRPASPRSHPSLPALLLALPLPEAPQTNEAPCFPLPGPPPARSRPALLLLLSFHNATYVTNYTPESPQEDLTRACSTAAGLLVKKLIVSGFCVARLSVRCRFGHRWPLESCTSDPKRARRSTSVLRLRRACAHDGVRPPTPLLRRRPSAAAPQKPSPPPPCPAAPLCQALRRLRLPLFYDSTAWVLPAGSLTHLMVTIPFWTR